VVICGAIALEDGCFRHRGLGFARRLLELAAVRGGFVLINTGLLFSCGFTGWRAVPFTSTKEPLKRLADRVVVVGGRANTAG
jgi:hypothetical protein